MMPSSNQDFKWTQVIKQDRSSLKILNKPESQMTLLANVSRNFWYKSFKYSDCWPEMARSARVLQYWLICTYTKKVEV